MIAAIYARKSNEQNGVADEAKSVTRRICQVLNAEGAPAPRAQQRRPNGWVPSSVRAVLYRDLYRGQQTWGRARKRNTWGQVAFSRRLESEWVRTSVPALRIVDDELWEAARTSALAPRA